MSACLRLAALLVLPLAILFATPAAAQVLTIGNGEVRRGNSVEIPIRFDSGPVAVFGYDLDVVYDPTRFDPPTCVAHNGAACAVHHSLGRVAMIHVNWPLAPITSGVYVTIRFPAARTTPRGASRLGARSISFADALGNRVDGTIYTGTIMTR